MTPREQEIYELIRKDPWISRKDIADRLGITGSSVGVHILNLTRKGLIKGKKYILNENRSVAVIGGSNIDLSGFPREKLKFHDSNPGTVRLSPGGVGRNIAENLARLGVPVQMLTALGRDVYGDKILQDCRRLNIDMNAVKISEDLPTSLYLSLQDLDGEMVLALSDMEICETINIDYIERNRSLIESARYAVVEANLSRSVLDHLFSRFPETTFYVDPVSTSKAEKIRDSLSSVAVLTCNRREAEVLCGMEIKTREDFLTAAEKLRKAGVGEFFISRGTEGTCYGSPEGTFFYKRPPFAMANSNGAGDAFLAGLVYGGIRGYSLHQKVRFAAAASALTVLCEETVNPTLTPEKVLELAEMKQETE